MPTSNTPFSNAEPPVPRKGWRGSLDSFIGPGATTAEVWFQFSAAILVALACLSVYAETTDHSSWKLYVTVLLLAFDLIGGVVTNSTSAAKRWYHRAGQGFVEHMNFIALHAIQIASVAFLFAYEHPWFYFGTIYGLLLLSSAVVLKVPLYLQRPVAMALVAASIPFSMSRQLVPRTPGLEWFIPLLFLKLLVAHLTVEAPYQPSRTARKVS